MPIGATNSRYTTYPTGWFQVGWSSELKAGDVQPLRYFGQDLVLYRGMETGQATVLDAHCLHLGAHLGHPLVDSPLDEPHPAVVADCIRCPWHGWCFDSTVANVEIPYSTRVHRGKGLRSWPVREVNGWITVWHDQEGGAPTWEPPVLAECQEDGDFYPYGWSIREWRNSRLRPEDPIGNGVDFAHLQWVHRHTGRIEVDYCEFHFPLFQSGIRTVFPTPEGLVPGVISPKGWGVGISAVSLSGIHDIVHIVNTTPIDLEYSDVFAAVPARRAPGEDEPPKLVRGMVKAEHYQVERDLQIWNHLEYVRNAPFAREEAEAYKGLRKWIDQFYPHEPAASSARLPSATSLPERVPS